MKASCTMFSRILKPIPRTGFERTVEETGAEYRSKGFSSWSQFVGALFCQMAGHIPCGKSKVVPRVAGAISPTFGSKRRRARRCPTPTATAVGPVREALLWVVRNGRRQWPLRPTTCPTDWSRLWREIGQTGH